MARRRAWLDSDVRFDRHKAAIQANRFVFRDGERLVQLYDAHYRMPHDAARGMEVERAIALQQAGRDVWQA